MKKQYWFVGLFGLWCLLSTLWYFLSVKGVSTSPPSFNPHDALVAILEILVMMLGACLLGYGIAWWLREEKIERQEERIDKLHAEKTMLTESHDDLKNQLELWRDKHKRDLESAQYRVNELLMEKSNLHHDLEETQRLLSVAKEENSERQLHFQQLDSEASTARYRIRQLEFQVQENEEQIKNLTIKMQSEHLRKEKSPGSDLPFIRSVDPDKRDDLTKIRGIGPFIEKRLNIIGIYTYEQLAELTPELVERVGAAIEFFPHRIVRDGWVSQAIKLHEAKNH
jgi:predicted flap endonuclease-1-like 5' DNA nuclease